MLSIRHQVLGDGKDARIIGAIAQEAMWQSA